MSRWPALPTRPLIGHLPRLLRGGFEPFVEASWRELGDHFTLQVGPETVKFVVHPDDVEAMLLSRRERYVKGAAYDSFRRLVGQGLVTSEGALWRHQRRIIQPSFGRGLIAKLGAQMVELTGAMLDGWERRIPAGQPFDVHGELMGLTLSIIGQGLFSIDMGEGAAKVSTDAFGESLAVLGERMVALVTPPPWLPTPGNRRLARAIGAIDDVVAGIIEERQARGDPGDDLLGVLMRAKTEDGEALPLTQVRDETVTMFLAGHETTAVALSWTLWLLSRAEGGREAREALVAEVDEELGGRPPEVGDLPRLDWTRKVFLESMRLMPPAWAGARNCAEADTLGGDYPVDVGDRVLHLIHLTHRHPGFWPEPDRFDPSRFDAARVAARHNFAYTPFSGGPRKCVGQHFATLEAQLVLATMVQRFTLEVPADFEAEAEYSVTTRPKHGMKLTWRPRD